MNLGIITPFPTPISGFCATRVTSVLSVEISSGMLIIFSLGFRGLCAFLFCRLVCPLCYSPGSQPPGCYPFLSALSRPLVF